MLWDPCGTSQWKVNMSSVSRCQGIVLPPALSFSPARLAIGPLGPCSPGIHFG